MRMQKKTRRKDEIISKNGKCFVINITEEVKNKTYITYKSQVTYYISLKTDI